MPDMTRDAITRLVYRRLADRRFRQRLTATDTDGNHTILISLRDDQVRKMLDQVMAAGGVGNVVVPTLNGVVVLAMRAESGASDATDIPPIVDSGCTVGVFLERLRMDVVAGEAVYRFAFEGSDQRPKTGEAELVALAG